MWNNTSEFYRSRDWETFRPVVIAERLTEDGFTVCEYCGKPIFKEYDLILHHIEPLTNENVNDVSVSLNPENIQIVHHKCHNKIHERFGTIPTRHVYIVYGAPCSGKSSFVSEVAGRHDLIVDMDSIFECISNNDRYDKPDSLKAVAFGVRDSLLDSIRVRRGKWTNAFIVGGYPMQSERARLMDIYGAEEIFIDAEKNDCFIRANDRPVEWREYIETWFERFTPSHLDEK